MIHVGRRYSQLSFGKGVGGGRGGEGSLVAGRCAGLQGVGTAADGWEALQLRLGCYPGIRPPMLTLFNRVLRIMAAELQAVD